jgi:hypothetical protein
MTTLERPEHLADQRALRVVAHFVDGNNVWTEPGWLARAELGPYGRSKTPGFALHTDDGGVRIFPLTGRDVEVYSYRYSSDDPIVRTSEWATPVDKFNEVWLALRPNWETVP